MEPGCCQWCPVPGQKAQTEAQEAPSDHQEALVCWSIATGTLRLWVSSLGILRSRLNVVLGVSAGARV